MNTKRVTARELVTKDGRFRTRYDGLTTRIRGLECKSTDENGKALHGRTQIHFQAECDINNIMKKYEKMGVKMRDLMVSNGRLIDAAGGRYGDFSNVSDYQSAIHQVAAAQSAFEGLPASVRARFDNNPANFLQFVENPENAKALVKMGLAIERPKQEASTAVKPEVKKPSKKESEEKPAE